MLRRIATALAALACLCGPSLVISRPLLDSMRERTHERNAVRVAALPQFLPWAAGHEAYVNQANHGRRTHLNDSNGYSWDFLLPMRTELRTGIAGVVESTGEGCHVTDSWGCHDGYGNHVKLQVADGTCASFLHLSTVAAREGQSLTVGDLIGTSGSSGSSTGPHLHYEREDCNTGRSFETSFYEAGKPVEGEVVVSALPGA